MKQKIESSNMKQTTDVKAHEAERLHDAMSEMSGDSFEVRNAPIKRQRGGCESLVFVPLLSDSLRIASIVTVMAASEAAKKTTKKKAPEHPPTQVMVNAAIGALKERNGSSLQAIKKYIAANYKVGDMDRQTIFIKRALRKGVANETLVQTKGVGASGSFKLNVKAAKAEAAEKARKEKQKAKAKADREKAKVKAAAKKEKAVAKKAKAAAEKKEKKKKATKKKPAKKTAAKSEKTKTPKKKTAAKKPSKKATPKKVAKKTTTKSKAAKPKKPAAKKGAK